MKRIWNLALGTAVLCTALLCGCALAGPTAPDSAAPTDPLTGQELQYPGERTAAVVIDNAASSTTQWGIGSASVVLEALTESGQPTSLCLAYPSVSAMPTVGPVTLGQDLYWRLLSGQEVLPIQRGAGQFARNYLDYYNLRAVDALEVGRNAFSCDDVWSGAPLWHTSGAEVASVLGSLNLSGALGDHGSSASSSASTAEDSSAISALPALLPQAKEPRLPEPGSRDAEQVQINFAPQSTTGFAYDAASGTYGMLRADGTAQLDANTGAQAQFDNLLVLYSASSLRDDGTTLDYDLSLGGGVWLNGSQLWHITWTQGTDSTFAFYDADGRPLTIRTGRSYIALVSSVTGQELTVLDSAGQALFAAYAMVMLTQAVMGRIEGVAMLIFMLAVFITSMYTEGYAWGVAASLISVLAVNFAFLSPYFAFNFTLSENLFSGLVMLVVSIMTSTLTTRIKKQEQLRMESEKEKMRANLLRAVSHDLRTPLTSIYGACSTVIENYDSLDKEKTIKLLGEACSDAQWLTRMVENLLSVTRIDSEKVTVQKTPTVLDELLDTVLVKFRKRYPEIPVELETPDAFIVIPMDSMLIQQVLMNLLENAALHAEGMTKLTLKVFTVGNRAVFEVTDNGCGIPRERLKTLFSGTGGTDPDVPADSRKHGMGIGLSVCAAIIKAHGGEIKAESRLGEGTTIRFWLETEEIEMEDAEDEQ